LGGTDVARHFLAAEREEETSPIVLPPFERKRLDSSGVAIPDWTMHPNSQYKYSVRANLNTSPSPKLDIGISSGVITGNTRFITESNATAGLGSQIFGGPGYK